MLLIFCKTLLFFVLSDLWEHISESSKSSSSEQKSCSFKINKRTKKYSMYSKYLLTMYIHRSKDKILFFVLDCPEFTSIFYVNPKSKLLSKRGKVNSISSSESDVMVPSEKCHCVFSASCLKIVSSRLLPISYSQESQD